MTKPKDLALVRPVSEWTDEELEHGRLMNSRGNFAGKPPKHPYQPREIIAEMRRRTLLWLDANQMGTLRKLDARVRVMVEDPNTEDRDIIKLWELMTNRVLGLPVASHIIAAQHQVSVEPEGWTKVVDEFVSEIDPEMLMDDKVALALKIKSRPGG